MTFSRDSLLTFAQLLDGYQLPSNHPQLVAVAQQIAVARLELQEALASLDESPQAAPVAVQTGRATSPEATA